MVIASWASGNRVAIFSGLRAVAVLISYEIPMALSLVGVLMISGTLSLNGIVESQKIPFILLQPLGFIVFFLASLAEINRTPFDLTEAESELAAGYLNDYSSMKFGIFFLAEFAAAIGASAVISTVFLAGWKGPELLPGEFWFAIKLGLVLFLIVWVRMSWPRMRIDQILQTIHIMLLRSFKLHIDSCFFTNGFSFQKIGGLEKLIKLSVSPSCSLILSKR